MNAILFSTWCACFLAFGSPDPAAVKEKVDPCQLYGAVYVEEVPSFAKYKVFVESDEVFSDLRVIEESTWAFADRPGLWYFTNNRNDANFTIGYTDTKAFADFSVFFTSFRSLAGCPK